VAMSACAKIGLSIPFFNSCYCLLFPWLPDNTVLEIRKTHKQSGSPHRLSWSRNSLATLGPPLAYLLAHLLSQEGQ
jgi:hypothetical protein